MVNRKFFFLWTDFIKISQYLLSNEKSRKKIRQSPIGFEKPGILSENHEILKSSNYPGV